MDNNSYRQDIQGLRAIAVLSVVIFHISPYHLPGGYIGVDMFFVISGYLIMGHIWRDLSNNSFRLIDFYGRRIKRLFPALLTVLLISSGFAYFILLPEEFKNFSYSLISSLFYVSNFWFYSKTGYFDDDLQISPLLHTWSLSVEEQFYIIFPILLLILYRRLKSKVVVTLTSVAIISFILSEILVNNDESLAFYASPSRFWQFIMGGLISITSINAPNSKTARNFLSGISLFVLFFCMLNLSSTTTFPGINALLPTIATAVAIYACKTNDFNYKVLSNPLVKFFGDISYSLYLWHWPLIIFYRLTIASDFETLDKVILFLTSTAFGFFSYRFIENPIRRVKINKQTFAPVFLSLSLSVLICLTIFLISKIHLLRFSEEQIHYAAYLKYDTSAYRTGKCFLTSEYNDFALFDKNLCVTAKKANYNILLIGDSHAAHWYSALYEKLNENETLTQVTASGCKPTIEYKGHKRCTDLIKWAYQDLIQKHKFNKIILSARWKKKDAVFLETTIAHLRKHIQDIVILGPVIEYDQALPRLLATSNSKQDLFLHAKLHSMKSIDQSISDTVKTSEARYISVLKEICSDDETCMTTINDTPLQFDYGHLTHQGAEYILRKINI